MSEDDRRKFLKASSAAVAASLVIGPASTLGNPLSGAAQKAKSPPIASTEMSAIIAVTGDLQEDPIFLTDVTAGQLTPPIDLQGKGKFRLALSPVGSDPTTGHGDGFKVLLADEDGATLHEMHIGMNEESIFAKCGIAVFGHQGVMVFVAKV